MAFVQIIELNTTRLDEIESLIDDGIAKTAGKRHARRYTLTAEMCEAPPVFRNLVRRVEHLS